MAYRDLKDLNRRKCVEKVLCDKAFNIAEDPKHDRYQCGHASMVYKFFNNTTSGTGIKCEKNGGRITQNNY